MELTYNPLALVNLCILQIHQNWKALLMAEKDTFHNILQQPLWFPAASHYNRLTVVKVISNTNQIGFEQ